MLRCAALLTLLLLPGCATIIEGTSQSVSVVTEPAGADCTIERKGARIGQVTLTPGAIQIDKSKEDLAIHCEHAGYEPANMSVSPRTLDTAAGNIVIGGLIGFAVDAATAANFKYPADVRIKMIANAPPPVLASPIAYKP
jgi:hypothetical protein